MNMQLQHDYSGIEISPAESRNVNLLTMVSKIVMALVMLLVAMIVSLVS